MNGWIVMGLTALMKLPIERLFSRPRDPMESVNKLKESIESQQPLSTPSKVAEPVKEEPQGRRVTTAETIAYQKRELGKEILLLEKHLQQKCKIGGIACDCCEKHPIVIEALAQETLGMSAEPIFNDIIVWIRGIAPMTTEAASKSGNYDEEYPQMAIKARFMRKTLMGTDEIKALLGPELSAKVSSQVEEIVGRAMKKEGGEDGRGRGDRATDDSV